MNKTEQLRYPRSKQTFDHQANIADNDATSVIRQVSLIAMGKLLDFYGCECEQ